MDVHFFVESIITALLPDRNTYIELLELLTTHEATTHSKSSRKYKNLIWRYNLGINFSFIISFLSAEHFWQFYHQVMAQKIEKCSSRKT